MALPSSRLSITDDGITVSGVTKEEFDNLDEIEYNARYDFPTGSYPTPPSMTSYTISSGTYDQYFDISHTLDLTADESFDYNQYDTTSEEQFLKDVHAETDDGTAVKSDFDQVVKLDVPGEYTVTLNAENAAGLKATPVTVKVTVHEKPVITSDSQISYKKETTKSVDEFLKEIHGSVTGNAVLTSDFDKVVDLNTPGEYTVTLNAINDRGQKADPVTVVVTVTTSDSGHVDPVPPTPEIKPTPQEETDQTITPEPQSETTEDPVKEDQAKDGQAKSEEKADKTSLTTKENKVEKSEKTNQPKTKALPQTGDTNKTALPIAGVMLSLAALLIFRKSKS